MRMIPNKDLKLVKESEQILDGKASQHMHPSPKNQPKHSSEH